MKMYMTKWFKFKPTKEILIVLASYIMVVSVFYFAFNIITFDNVAPSFIAFGVIGIALLGIAVPALWTVFIKKRPLSALGIKKDKLIISLVIGFLLCITQYFLTLKNLELPASKELIPLATMAVAVGLFENIFFRGWVQLRMEECFGIIPGILLSSVIYAVYHIGYGMGIEEMLTLFIVGLAYSTIFRLTSNIFILFPLLTPTGALFTQIKDGLRIPFEATLGFADVIVGCILILYFINKFGKRKNVSLKASASM
jgi:membrane protease YdiL (CAAX protease family)